MTISFVAWSCGNLVGDKPCFTNGKCVYSFKLQVFESEIENLEVEWFKNHFGEEPYSDE